MEISRVLRVGSPEILYRMLLGREEVLDSAKGDVLGALRFFMDSVEAYERSCCCDKEKNRDIMVYEYENSVRREDVLAHLRRMFCCDEVRFF